jgi:hypothetical protein
MFTMKVIEPSGLEHVKQVESLMFCPTNKATDGRDYVTYFGAGSDPKALDIFEGDVYLMNEYGKTVADYHLEKSPLLYGRS